MLLLEPFKDLVRKQEKPCQRCLVCDSGLYCWNWHLVTGSAGFQRICLPQYQLEQGVPLSFELQHVALEYRGFHMDMQRTFS